MKNVIALHDEESEIVDAIVEEVEKFQPPET